ncbi:MAG: FHA domain-containing protein [Cystobacterineae bacterium]|nr:FHA domain-containing protein [Cystobacterineae bacterium]
MLSVKELKSYAQMLSAEEFLLQLGPFALIQKPGEIHAAWHTEKMGLPNNIAMTHMVAPETVSTAALSLLFQFEELVVATLPPLQGSDMLYIGRQPDCELVLDHPSVSKRHALLRWNAAFGRSTLTDLGSTNGTLLNASTRLRRETILKDGDIISFGEVQFWYLLSSTLHQKLAEAPMHLHGD